MRADVPHAPVVLDFELVITDVRVGRIPVLPELFNEMLALGIRA